MSRKFFLPLQIQILPLSRSDRKHKPPTGKTFYHSQVDEDNSTLQNKKNFFSNNSKRSPKYLCILCLFTPIVYSVSPTPPRDCKTNYPDGQLCFLHL
ncbi:hypothetical protein CEXT_326851 [Caerostris extrusa]|uniref:Uncharacterized protein n=1 Tax=Caerostris extrusa TaxID=172846 RepID=A0AAV4T2U5_CAEEX|nr:hypothetical protein CEXT_326851 [Caerostris extrusa]